MFIAKVKRIVKEMFGTKNIVNVKIDTLAKSDELESMVVMVTGGDSGIGKSTALSALNAGAKVIIVGRNEDKLRNAVIEMGGVNVKYIVQDVNYIENYDEFFDHATHLFDHEVDALVNNAGVYIQKNPMEYTKKDFFNLFLSDLQSPIILIQKYVQYCIDNGIKGNIVCTSSNRSLFGDDGPYGVAKRGLNSYIEGMALRYIDFIRINGVAPGMTATGINNIDVSGNMYDAGPKNKRVLAPQEIAEVIVFLLSNRSQCITGAVIPCDCGDRLR